MSELLLSARPPTPPPSRSKDVSSRSIVSAVLQGPATLGTPPASTPPSNDASSELHSSGSSGSRKRVGFFLEHPQTSAANIQSPNKPILKAVPPSRESKATKSILKQSVQSVEPHSSDEQPTTSSHDLATMLDSLLVQLSNGHRSTSIDAYANLCGIVRVTDKAPETYLKDKMGPLLRHIRRDLQKEACAPRTEAMNLTTHAIKFLIILLWNPKLSLSFTDEYRSFLLDSAAAAIEDKDTPKAVVLHYMRLLQTQDFRPNVMTPARTAGILDVLYVVTNHINGNGVVSQRLEVYSHLMDQCKGPMKARVGWVEHLLAGMLMPSKDTRAKAISLGVKTVQTFASSSTISTACRDALNRRIDKASDSAMTFSFVACRRLRQMVKNSEDSFHAPQIWGLVILLLKGIYPKIQEWTDFKDWLMVVQACFNCSDSATRAQANLAWNRLVYVVNLRENTDPSIVKMLIKPITTQFERSSSDRQGKGSRLWAASTFYILLYYGFRPSSSFKQLDVFWKSFISEILTEKYLSNSVNADSACRVLTNLLCSSRGKIWRDTRAIELPRMEPEELPVLDCRWIRSRSPKVLAVFRRLSRSASWGVGDPEQAFIGSAWKHFSQAIGDACRKEIKVSSETVQTIAHLISFLRSIWLSGTEALHIPSSEAKLFLQRFTFLVQSLLTEIGPIPFSEPLYGLDEHMRMTPLTSLSANSRAQGSSAIEVLLKTVSNPPEGVIINESYSQLVDDFLRIPLQARSSIHAQIELCRTCSGLPLHQASISETQVRSMFWRSSASLTSQILTDRLAELSRGGDASFSSRDTVIENAVSILKSVSSSLEFPNQETWAELLESLLSLVEQTCGQRSWSSLVLEPLAKHLLSFGDESSFLLAAKLLESVLSQRVWASLQSMLKNSRLSSAKTVPLQHIATLTGKMLQWCYEIDILPHRNEVESLVESCRRLIDSSSTEYLSLVLQDIATPICLWLEDSECAITQTPEEATLRSLAACKLCPVFIRMARRLIDDSLLSSGLEEIFCAGLRSTHLSTINRTIDILKLLPEKDLNGASPSLQEAIVRLGADTGLPLGKDVIYKPEDYLASLQLIDSQCDGLQLENKQNILPGFFPHGLTIDRQRNVTEDNELNHANQPSPMAVVKLRLRNDDSQIQYVTIDSSPVVEDQLDSQFLTHRQKEVRERQRTEPVTTFSDLISSPAAIKAEKHPGNLMLSRNRYTSDDRSPANEEPSTPVLPEPIIDVEEHIPSSPTPTYKSYQLHFSEIDVPSSPLSSSHERNTDPAMKDQPDHGDNHVVSSSSGDGYQTAPQVLSKSQLDGPSGDIPLPDTEYNVATPFNHETAVLYLNGQFTSVAPGDELVERDQRSISPSNAKDPSEPEDSADPARSDIPSDDTSNAAKASKFSSLHPVGDIDEPKIIETFVEEYQASRIVTATDSIQPTAVQPTDVLQSSLDPCLPDLSSDEIDDLTASQLENELQYTTIEDGELEDTPSSSIVDVQAINSPATLQTSNQVAQTNKEESRKENLIQESLFPSQNEFESSRSNSMPELLDTIIVDMTSYRPLHPISNSQPPLSAASQTNKRSRGRPRGTKRKTTDVTPGDELSQSSFEVRITPRKRAKTKASFTPRRSPRFDEIKEEEIANEEVAVDQTADGYSAEMDVLIDEDMDNEMAIDTAGSILDENASEEPQQPNNSRAIFDGHVGDNVTPDSIKNDLNGILRRLRNSKLSQRDLREIDNLAFDIRTEAQKAVERRGKS